MLTRSPESLPLFARVAAAAVVAAVVAARRAGSAQPGHRARLSRDLAERIEQRVEASTDVIVSASDGGIDRLVARYGARLKKRIHGGAVLEATGGQIDAMSQDPDVDHMAGDATVYRMMAVTTQATGADQVWAGLDGAARLHRARDWRRGDRLGRRGARRAEGPRRRVDGLHRRRERRRRGASTSTATARTSRASSREGAKDGFGGMAPGAWIVNLKVLEADGSGKTSDVIEAIDWAIANRRRSTSGSSTCRSGTRCSSRTATIRCARRRSARSTRGSWWWRRRGISARPTDGRPIVGGVIAPGNTPSVLTVGAINTRGTARRVGRRDGDVQLAGPDVDRRRAEAGAGGAGQPDRGGVGGRRLPGADVSGAGGERARRRRRISR